MNIHQLSVSYVAEEDRILVRVNTKGGEEMRLWFTRRLMAGLWPLLSRLLTEHLLKLEAAGAALDSADDALKQMLADFRKEEFLQSADFATPYQDEGVELPLGEAPLLVTDVDATPLPVGSLRLGFNERDKGAQEGRSFQIDMQPKLMQGLMFLLEQALEKSQWRQSFAAAASEDSPNDSSTDQSPRPRYMN